MYDATLRLANGADGTIYTAYLNKTRKDMTEITAKYMNLETSKKSKKADAAKANAGELFGKAGEREQEEAKTGMDDLTSKKVC